MEKEKNVGVSLAIQTIRGQSYYSNQTRIGTILHNPTSKTIIQFIGLISSGRLTIQHLRPKSNINFGDNKAYSNHCNSTKFFVRDYLFSYLIPLL